MNFNTLEVRKNKVETVICIDDFGDVKNFIDAVIPTVDNGIKEDIFTDL